MKVGFISLGCAKNQVNCEQMIWQTYEAGYEVALGAAGCDVAVVNTCGFLQEAREEALAEIQKLVEQKQAGQLQKDSGHWLHGPVVAGPAGPALSPGRRLCGGERL